MLFLSLRVTADAEGGLKIRAQLRPDLQGFGGGQPPTSMRRVYTGALLATTTTINFTLTLQYLSFDFYTAAVFFSRTQKSKGDI